MPVVAKQIQAGATVTLLSTELNSLANNTNVVSSVGGTSGVFTSTPGGGTSNLDGYTRGLFELVLASPGGTLAAASSFKVWFLQQIDGTNFEDGGSSVTPARVPDLVIPVRAASGAQRIVRRGRLPAGVFKVLGRNDATGQTFGSSGNTLKVLAETDEGV